MVQSKIIMTELEKELFYVFEKIGLDFGKRRYYDEIFLSGYTQKIIDEMQQYRNENIDKIARFIAINDFADGVEFKLIREIVKSALKFANSIGQDEIDYQNEIADNANGGFGIAIPLVERVFCHRDFLISHTLFPEYNAEIFSSKEKFDLLRPIKNNINFIIENNYYRESVDIMFDESVKEMAKKDSGLIIPERSSILPKIIINNEKDYYSVELDRDFKELVAEFDLLKIWDVGEEAFISSFPEWCRPVSKNNLQNIYKIFKQFATNYNNCKNPQEIAKAICSLIYSC